MYGPIDPRSGMDTTDVLAARYAALRVELTRLYSAPVADLVAIDDTMKKIDAVHVRVKDVSRNHDDPQLF